MVTDIERAGRQPNRARGRALAGDPPALADAAEPAGETQLRRAFRAGRTSRLVRLFQNRTPVLGRWRSWRIVHARPHRPDGFIRAQGCSIFSQELTILSQL
jgi:hypothetical protein